MEKTHLNDGLMAQMIEEEAWKDLSGEYPWSEALLERFKDKVDWEAVSSNSDVAWTVTMIEKFKNRINWYELSRTSIKSLLTPEVVELETIREMADYIDWKALIDCRYRDDIFSMEFLKEFEERIPASSFKDSGLWRKIVEDKVEKLRAEILLG